MEETTWILQHEVPARYTVSGMAYWENEVTFDTEQKATAWLEKAMSVPRQWPYRIVKQVRTVIA